MNKIKEALLLFICACFVTVDYIAILCEVFYDMACKTIRGIFLHIPGRT